MIVIVNNPAFLDVAGVAAALGSRLSQPGVASSTVDMHAVLARPLEGERTGSLEERLYAVIHERVRLLKERGQGDVVVAGVFHEPEPLARLRRRLSDLDDVIYAFRPRYDRDNLARSWDHGPDSDELCDLLDLFDQWLAAQRQGARRGDMGYAILVDRFDPGAAAAAIWDDIHEPVELSDPDPDWPAQFAEARARIDAALEERALSIEHIGSTAVPGLPAKPIIDILVTVRDLDRDAVECIAPLSTLGYAFVDYPQNTERRFFRKGRPRSHHIQIVDEGSEVARAYLAFRDALRADATLREEYAALKRATQAELRLDRAEFGARKSAFIQRVLSLSPSAVSSPS
jgi:GrpB-like predicted nucleotidyltransferase (UPF0157 family)